LGKGFWRMHSSVSFFDFHNLLEPSSQIVRDFEISCLGEQGPEGSEWYKIDSK
jgi:hypothetical protein